MNSPSIEELIALCSNCKRVVVFIGLDIKDSADQAMQCCNCGSIWKVSTEYLGVEAVMGKPRRYRVNETNTGDCSGKRNVFENNTSIEPTWKQPARDPGTEFTPKG